MHCDHIARLHHTSDGQMDDSSLGKLSAEIRNAIYSLVVTHDAPYRVTADRKGDKLCTEKRCAQQQPLALSATCRQMRNETMQTIYHVNTFDINIFNIRHMQSTDGGRTSETGILQRFCAGLGPLNASALRSIKVTFRSAAFYRDGMESEFISIRHKMPLLRALRASIPDCEIVARFIWEEFNDEVTEAEWQGDQKLLAPRVAFLVDPMDEGLTDAIARLRSYTQEFSPYHNGPATREIGSKCHSLRENLEEIVAKNTT